MADGGYDGQLALVDGTGHALVVEGPEVLYGAAAAAGYDDVRYPVAVGVADGADDLRRGLHALHAHGQQHDLRHRPALAQDADDIVHRRASRGGDDGYALRIARDGLLVHGVEEALLTELFLQLLIGHLQISRALGHEALAVELVGPVPRIDRDAAPGCDAHAALRAEAQLRGRGAEHDAAQAGLRVLEREIVMPRGVDLVVRQLAAHADGAEQGVRLNKSLYPCVQLRYAYRLSPGHVSSGAGRSPRMKPPSTPFMKATVSGSS